MPGCGASGYGRSPTPDLSSFRACGRGPLLTGCGCAGCGRGDPSPTPQRALLRAGFARCGHGMRVPGQGPSCLGVGRPGTGALPPPTTRHFGRAAGAHYPLAVGAGAAGVGTPHQPHCVRSCKLALRAVGAASGCPGEGASRLGVGRPGPGTLPPPDHSSVRACGRGPLPTSCGCGGCGRGDPPPTPQRALSLAGFARCGGGTRVPGGAPLAWVWGVRGRALSHPRPLVLWGVRPGPTTHWLWVRGLRAWGRVTNPTARALASWLCALWGRHVGARGGAPLAWVWGVRGRALSHARLLVLSGVRPGPATNWLWVRGVRAWGPISNPTARALASWLCALWGRLVGARGGRLLPGCGASGDGRSPTPDLSSFRACGRGPLPTGRGCGVRA